MIVWAIWGCRLPAFAETYGAAENRVTLTAVVFEDKSHEYYYELLEKALKNVGYTLELQEIPDIPQKRIVAMLDQDDGMFFHMFIHTRERDEKWVPVEVGLTNSLIAHRILFIPRGQQHLYNDVNALGDFRALGKVGAFGKGWYDAKVWEHFSNA